MNHPCPGTYMRSSLTIVFAAALILIVTAGKAESPQRDPYIPANAQVVLQRVPKTSDPRVRRFDQLRATLTNKPHLKSDALKLARAYIDYGRSTGDARYLGRALAVIEPWLRKTPQPLDIRLVRATILQSRHHFRAARDELASILKRDPGNAQAWLTLATVDMVQGDYAAANQSCVKLAASGGDFMGIMCGAQLRSLTGQTQQAYRLFGLIEHSGPKVPLDVKAYVQGLMADTAQRLGNAAQAEAHFRKALQLTPGDNFLLADYADFLLDQNRPNDVIDLVASYTQSDTSFLRLVLAEAAMGKPRAAHDVAQMQARFAAMEQRGSHVYRREQARFVLELRHDPPRALQLARQNWQVQRAPKDMRIFLEAALAAHDASAAKPVLALLDQSHLQDPVIDRLAGRVRAQLDAIGSTTGASAP